MKNENKLINTAKVIVLAFMLTVGIQYVAAQTWSPPTVAPGAGNTYAPINVGPSAQVKDGGLILGYTFGGGSTLAALNIYNGRVSIGAGVSPAAKLDVVGNIKITDGTQGVGKVLTSDANGLATWQTPAAGGGASQWTTSGSNIYNNNAGNVGVGTANPTQKLHVEGNLRVNGQIYDIRNLAGNAGDILMKSPGVSPSGNNPVWEPFPGVRVTNNTGVSGYVPKWTNANTLSATSKIYDDGTRVGINTSSPTGATFVVNGSAKVGSGGLAIDLAAGSGSTGRDAIVITSSSDNNRGNILVNKSNIEFWNTSDTTSSPVELRRANLLAKGLTLSGGSPAAGKVLTATDSDGNSQWQSLVSPVMVSNTSAHTSSSGSGVISKYATCAPGKVVISCSGGVIQLGQGSGVDNEASIISPDIAGQRCKIEYEQDLPTGTRVEVYALCM